MDQLKRRGLYTGSELAGAYYSVAGLLGVLDVLPKPISGGDAVPTATLGTGAGTQTRTASGL